MRSPQMPFTTPPLLSMSHIIMVYLSTSKINIGTIWLTELQTLFGIPQFFYYGQFSVSRPNPATCTASSRYVSLFPSNLWPWHFWRAAVRYFSFLRLGLSGVFSWTVWDYEFRKAYHGGTAPISLYDIGGTRYRHDMLLMMLKTDPLVSPLQS